VPDRRITRGIVAVLAALLAACATQVGAPLEVERKGPVDFPAGYYQRLRAQGKAAFRVDPARSLAVIEVRRGGSLARFGHDHVIASHDVAGYVAPNEGRADLYVPLDALVVDESHLRAEAGFDTQPSPTDIAGTRSNMLEKVLETDRYPYALIAVSDRAAAGKALVGVTVTLHGTTRFVDAAMRLEESAEEVWVTGTVALDQSEFGIVPFSILGGAIAVQDRVNITFRIRARRME
jgi:polyisoprenoid-binding protein YceI